LLDTLLRLADQVDDCGARDGAKGGDGRSAPAVLLIVIGWPWERFGRASGTAFDTSTDCSAAQIALRQP